MPPLRIHACSIAISSVVKTDRIGFSLILDVWPSCGTTKASPTVLAVGSLLPSVAVCVNFDFVSVGFRDIFQAGHLNFIFTVVTFPAQLIF